MRLKFLRIIKKPLYWLLLKTKKLSSLSFYLLKFLGKTKEPIHPKHLLKRDLWFLKELKKTDKVLDLGCGNGQNSLKVAKFCKRVIALEKNRSQLKIAQREKRRQKIENIKFISFDLEKIKLNYQKETFDVVLLLDVLEHLNHRQEILKEIYRVLKRKGKLILSVPNKETSWKKELKSFGFFYYADLDHKIEYTKKEIKNELKKGGFRIIKIMPIVYDTPWIGLVDFLACFSLNLYKKITLWREKTAYRYPSESTGFRLVCLKN